VGALLASLLVVLEVPFILYILKIIFDGYWYADATRFIHNTIHEFPSYSPVSDLHVDIFLIYQQR
jgi:hypothetical protein